MSRKTDRGLATKLEAIYAQLPAIACRGRCAEACGAILLSSGEADRLRRYAHQTPRTTTAGTRCIYLTPQDRCRVYAVRPLICRVFALVKRMSCPHGCVPDRWLTDHEFVTLAAQVEDVAGELQITTPEGAQPIGAGRGFQDLRAHLSEVDEAAVNVYAELTRGLRALHGGRIIGVAPRADDEERWQRVGRPRPQKE